MRRLVSAVLLLASLALSPLPSAAGDAAAEALAGTWEGMPTVFAGKRVRLRFEKGEAWSGHIAFPDSMSAGTDGTLPEKELTGVEVALPEVRFVLEASPAAMVFEGKLDGDRLSGGILLEGMGAVGSFEFERQ